MENPEWFYFDEDEFRYKLTDKAPEKAVRSYEEFCSKIESADDGFYKEGVILVIGQAEKIIKLIVKIL